MFLIISQGRGVCGKWLVGLYFLFKNHYPSHRLGVIVMAGIQRVIKVDNFFKLFLLCRIGRRILNGYRSDTNCGSGYRNFIIFFNDRVFGAGIQRLSSIGTPINCFEFFAGRNIYQPDLFPISSTFF